MLSIKVLILVAVAMAALGAGVVGWLVSISGGTSASRDRAGPSSALADPAAANPAPARPTVTDRWGNVLQRIDSRRSRAWASGDPALLLGVYTSTSPQLETDQAMLRAYVARGLRVHGVAMIYSSVEVTRQAPDVAELVVIDRLRACVAVGPNGARMVLPLDEPTRHRMVLRHTGGRWRIDRVSIA